MFNTEFDNDLLSMFILLVTFSNERNYSIQIIKIVFPTVSLYEKTFFDNV